MPIKKVPAVLITAVIVTHSAGAPRFTTIKVVTAGSIIVRQSGTRFQVGKNVGLGKNFSIYR
jgi:ribosomal protein L27